MVPQFDSVILFGAGAPRGLPGIVPERPPLGNQLFGRLAHHYPATWGALPTSLRSVFLHDGFEGGMAVIWRHHAPQVPALMRQMALFFLSFDILLSSTNVNPYCELAQLVEDQTLDSTLFSTLNYDCLLEIAFASRQLPFRYFEEDGGATPIWKLHGSCNFRVPAAAPPSAGAPPLEHMAIDEAHEHWLWQSSDSVPPAMSILMRDGEQTSHPQVLQLVDRWGDIVRHAQSVVVVGANPCPEEARIWGPLSETPAVLVYVGDRGAFNRWVASHRRHGPSEFAGPTFEQAFDTVVGALLQ